jgi:hypothetical protein
MTRKRLHVTMPDGSEWAIDAELVAESRARYYANDGALASTAVDNDDLIDWAQNNMNWEDVMTSAVMVVTPDSHVDYQEGWVNGEMRVVDD